MMSKEALQQALEALERGETELRWKAITAIREALAEQPAPATELREQEPVANETKSILLRMAMALEVVSNDWRISDPALRIDIANMLATPLAAQPAVPLRDEEIENVWRTVQANDFHDCVRPFARAIEAAHGIKGDA